MTTREAMENLAHSIIQSYDTRAGAITALRKDVSDRRAAMSEAFDAFARQQHPVLAKGRFDLAALVAAQLAQLAKARKAATDHQWRDLANGRSELTMDTSRQLRDLAAARRAMGRRQHAGLASGRAALAGTTAALVSGFAAAHRAMARRQRSDLAQARSALDRVERHRKHLVAGWIRAVAETQAGAHAAWEGLCRAMEGRRQDGVALGQPGSTPPDTRSQPALVLDTASPNGDGFRPDGDTTETLEERVLDYLAHRQEGARLTEVVQELALGRAEAAKAVRRLLDQGKVRKRDLVYLAA